MTVNITTIDKLNKRHRNWYLATCDGPWRIDTIYQPCSNEFVVTSAKGGYEPRTFAVRQGTSVYRPHTKKDWDALNIACYRVGWDGQDRVTRWSALEPARDERRRLRNLAILTGKAVSTGQPTGVI